MSWRPGPWTAALLVVSVVFAAWTFSPVWWSQVGQDANVFYAAGSVSRSGGDVYNVSQLFAEEDRLFGAGHGGGSTYSHATFANPPLFAKAMEPSATLPPTAFHLLWLSITGLAGLVALLALFEALHWDQRTLAVAFLMTCSPMLLALFVGNTTTFLLMSWSASLLLCSKQRPISAGAVLSICWLKPSVGLPIAAALLLTAPVGRKGARIKATTAFAAATGGLVAVQTAITGTAALGGWTHALLQYGSALGSTGSLTVYSANMSGLASLPALWLGSQSTVVSVGLATLVLAAILLGALRSRDLVLGLRETPMLGLAIAQTAALALCPYLHFNDLALAAMPLLILAGCTLNLFSRITLVLWAVASPAWLVLVALMAQVAPFDYASLPSTGIILITLTFASLCAALPRRTGATSELVGIREAAPAEG